LGRSLFAHTMLNAWLIIVNGIIIHKVKCHILKTHSVSFITKCAMIIKLISNTQRKKPLGKYPIKNAFFITPIKPLSPIIPLIIHINYLFAYIATMSYNMLFIFMAATNGKFAVVTH
jgi:prepilin signal peptidase PulO-like enzyme (type II secretory pathway)